MELAGSSDLRGSGFGGDPLFAIPPATESRRCFELGEKVLSQDSYSRNLRFKIPVTQKKSPCRYLHKAILTNIFFGKFFQGELVAHHMAGMTKGKSAD
jgi:hypothetical protein